MGGSSALAPTPPTAVGTATESTEAQLAQLPSILKAQQEFGPQFAQQQIDQLLALGPQALQAELGFQKEFGPQFAEAQRAQREIEAPELGTAQDVLNKFLQEENLLTPQEEEQFRADSRAATSVRGLGEGGEAALEEIRGLTALRQQLKAQRLNIALSTAGRTPIGGSLVGQPNVGTGQLVQNVAPTDIFGLTNNNFTQQSRNFQASQAARGDIIGGALGAVGSIGGAIIGTAFAPGAGTAAGAAAGGSIGGAV